MANGVTYGYLADGPDDGPLALCLHGFPDSAHTWRHLLPELAGAGFHTVAPFLRGYAPPVCRPTGRYDQAALWPATSPRCTTRSAATAAPC